MQWSRRWADQNRLIKFRQQESPAPAKVAGLFISDV
jgi:hypothetical protein